jgi:hypothetical protein
MMRRLLTVVTGLATLAAFTAISQAQITCPAEIGQAKELLSRKGGLRAEGHSQPPKSLAGSQTQAQPGQDAQAPRGQDAQAPQSLAGAQWTGKLVRASRLVHEAEAACKAGDLKMAKSKAEAALVELK